MKSKTISLFILLSALLLSACGSKTPTETPTQAAATAAPTAAPTEAPTQVPPTPEEEIAPETGGLNPMPGAPGIGDSIFPLAGNGGTDVQHYSINLAWDDKTGAIDGSTTLTMQATQDLSAFNLDFHGLDISAITVDGATAKFSRDGDELTITPPAPIANGAEFEVVVSYNGVPIPPETVIVGSGWTTTENGVYTLSVPNASINWFPSNNHPKDKASYDFTITVPTGYDVVANGLPGEPIENGDTTTYTWVAKDPMVTYAAGVFIGHFDLQKQEGPGGLPILNYIFTGAPDEIKYAFDDVPEMLTLFEKYFGPYPFESAGGIVINEHLVAALEIQTRPLYGNANHSQFDLAHELAHQWFGDLVSLSDWSSVWLKEGFANYGAALWDEHLNGPESFDHFLRTNYNSTAFGFPLPRATLSAFLDNLGHVPEVNMSREEVAALLALPEVNVNDDSSITLVEVSDEQIQAVLTQVPDEGISNRDLEALLTDLPPFTGWPINAQTYPVMREALTDTDEQAAGLDYLASFLLAPPPLLADEADEIYSNNSYNRSMLALHALRLRVGDDVFFKIVRTYFERYAGGNAGTEELIQVAEEVSGQNWHEFFNAWLADEKMPDIPEMGLSSTIGK